MFSKNSAIFPNRHLHLSEGRDKFDQVCRALPGGVVLLRVPLHDRRPLLRRARHLHPPLGVGLRLHRGGVRAPPRVPLPVGGERHIRVSLFNSFECQSEDHFGAPELRGCRVAKNI